jgi:aryl-alcohol dehydrogenase-like predicted oxidoreductase
VVSALGLGCMATSEFYAHSDRDEALNTIAAALDAGVSLFDTGDFYGMGDNEILLAEALRGQREKAFVQVKSGAQRGPDGEFIGIDTRPSVLKNALAYSLKRLKTDHIDLNQVGQDPAVPIEDTVGAISDLVQQGYVRYVGLTNVDAETVRRGHSTHPPTAQQLEYSLMARQIEHAVLPMGRELGSVWWPIRK